MKEVSFKLSNDIQAYKLDLIKQTKNRSITSMAFHRDSPIILLPVIVYNIISNHLRYPFHASPPTRLPNEYVSKRRNDETYANKNYRLLKLTPGPIEEIIF